MCGLALKNSLPISFLQLITLHFETKCVYQVKAILPALFYQAEPFGPVVKNVMFFTHNQQDKAIVTHLSLLCCSTLLFCCISRVGYLNYKGKKTAEHH